MKHWEIKKLLFKKKIANIVCALLSFIVILSVAIRIKNTIPVLNTPLTYDLELSEVFHMVGYCFVSLLFIVGGIVALVFIIGISRCRLLYDDLIDGKGSLDPEKFKNRCDQVLEENKKNANAVMELHACIDKIKEKGILELFVTRDTFDDYSKYIRYRNEQYKLD